MSLPLQPYDRTLALQNQEVQELVMSIHAEADYLTKVRIVCN